MSALKFGIEEGVARITLTNPPQNRLTAELMEAFAAAVMTLSQDDEVRVLLVSAEGDDFSFGGDITPWTSISSAEFTERMRMGIQLSNLFQDLPFPIVFAVHGMCGGGGFELALRGDIVIASEDATFCHTEATIGVFTFLGGVQRVAERVGRTRAMQWASTAEKVPAQLAVDTGLINEVVARDELARRADYWVQLFAKGATRSHAVHKQLLRAWSNGGIGAADELMPELAGEILHSEDAQGCLPGAIAALAAGEPRPSYPFKGK